MILIANLLTMAAVIALGFAMKYMFAALGLGVSAVIVIGAIGAAACFDRWFTQRYGWSLWDPVVIRPPSRPPAADVMGPNNPGTLDACGKNSPP